MIPNFDNDKFFLDLVLSGVLKIDSSGKVFNPATDREIGYTNNRGYRAIGIRHDGKVRHMLIHRLVMLVHGDGFTEDRPIVNHIKNIRTLNAINNLEAVSYKENSAHASASGSLNYPRPKGEDCYISLLTNAQAKEIRNKNANGISYRLLMQEYGVGKTTIARIVQGKTYIGA